MEMLKLALKAGLPMIYVRTDDLIHIQEVLSYIAGAPVLPYQVPEVIHKISDLTVPKGRLFYTSSECKSLVKLYHFCVDNEKTLVFVNTEKSVLQFDGGTLVPPKGLVLEFLQEISEDAEALMPSFGGMTLKDVGEVAKMTMTRDESLTGRGVNETRRGYRNLKGIQQVDTNLEYYVQPHYLKSWLDVNAQFFLSSAHEALTPRGLLFSGNPGTGKTLAAKAIAVKLGVPLYRLDIGAMKGKYVGDSEGNLIAALSQIDAIEPAVVIFDEVEKVFQSQGDSGVTSSMLSQLLWWLQEHTSRVFTVMTTNDKEIIPKELYREGRVDKVMEFMGIDNLQEGCDFAKGSFDTMLGKIGAVAEEEHYAELNKRVKQMFSDGMAVPQSKITQTTYTLVRELLSDMGASSEEEEQVAGSSKKSEVKK